ncbi:hypothetical protein FGB62_212g02 [Gracilaria domingensis]|nr:hypothetical protein FGB62_212g02 [Gracilaria domingensis]
MHCRKGTTFLLAILSSTLCVTSHVAIHTPPATLFHAFGPLPAVSTPGSNPLHAAARYTHIALANLFSFPSEAARGGQASWRPCTYNDSDASVTCPFEDVDPGVPYVFWAAANLSFSPAESHTAILRATDPLLLVPKTGGSESRTQSCHADINEDNRALCVLRFEAEDYRMLVSVIGQGNHSAFLVSYEKPPSYVQSLPLLALNHTALPDVITRAKPFSASLAGNQMSVALLNAHHSHYATHGVATLVNPPPGLHLRSPALVDLGPRQSRSLRIDLSTDSKFQPSPPGNPEGLSLVLNIAYTINGTRAQVDIPLSLRLIGWGVDRAYVFTYIDTDRSVQACAVVPPAHPCTHPNGCVPLLSTHGAGVDATALAWTESYRAQNGSWVVLPTGRRRYGMNWEGAQMKSAIAALETLVRDMPGVPQDERSLYALRRGAWLQAGHSMGGHGALLIASHYPDSIVAALPAMAWMRLERYDGGGFGEDASFANAGIHALLAVGREQYASDLYHENLLGIPFLARVGSDDDNVPRT